MEDNFMRKCNLKKKIEVRIKKKTALKESNEARKLMRLPLKKGGKSWERWSFQTRASAVLSCLMLFCDWKNEENSYTDYEISFYFFFSLWILLLQSI